MSCCLGGDVTDEKEDEMMLVLPGMPLFIVFDALLVDVGNET